MNFITDLENNLRSHSDRENAIPMENYMKNNFDFLGIKTNERRAILKENCEKYKQEVKINYRAITWELFQKREREFHLCAIDIFIKEIKTKYVQEDIILIEKLIITNSWWDSVDTIAKYLVGGYLQSFPKNTFEVIERFSNSKNV